MNKLTALVLVIACASGAHVLAQTTAATPKAGGARRKQSPPKAVAATSPKKPKKQPAKKKKQIACELVVWPKRHGLEHQRTDHDGNLR